MVSCSGLPLLADGTAEVNQRGQAVQKLLHKASSTARHCDPVGAFRYACVCFFGYGNLINIPRMEKVMGTGQLFLTGDMTLHPRRPDARWLLPCYQGQCYYAAGLTRVNPSHVAFFFLGATPSVQDGRGEKIEGFESQLSIRRNRSCMCKVSRQPDLRTRCVFSPLPSAE